AVTDFFHPDRIVVGVESNRATKEMQEIYRPVLERTVPCPVHTNCTDSKQTQLFITDTNSAELIKHASNSFLAMKISFINMIADWAHGQAYDPKAMGKARLEMPQVTYCRDAYEAADRADAIVVLTEWEEFRRLDWHRIVNLVERALVVDGRNTLPRETIISHG